MRINNAAALIALCHAAQAGKIVISNDDGWAEINIRVFYDYLTKAGNTAFISAPAVNKSGTGSSDATPEIVTDGCEFGSCPPGSPAIGTNATSPEFNYVNAFPATAMRYGIQNLSSHFLGGAPDIAVAGPNVGANLGSFVVGISGTAGAAAEAAKLGVPAVAFSGASGTHTAWNTSSVPGYSKVYARLAMLFTHSLLWSGQPYLPGGVWLNVNYGGSGDGKCESAKDFKYVLSRIADAGEGDAKDVVTCGNGGRLPTEAAVIGTAGCYASVSVARAEDKKDASEEEQAVVLRKLRCILTCLPSA